MPGPSLALARPAFSSCKAAPVPCSCFACLASLLARPPFSRSSTARSPFLLPATLPSPVPPALLPFLHPHPPSPSGPLPPPTLLDPLARFAACLWLLALVLSSLLRCFRPFRRERRPRPLGFPSPCPGLFSPWGRYCLPLPAGPWALGSVCVPGPSLVLARLAFRSCSSRSLLCTCLASLPCRASALAPLLAH